MITSMAALHQLTERLATESLIAVDTESNSLYAYREQVCLIQISTRHEDWLIDPLAVHDLTALGALMANAAIEKVLHAADNDVMCLKRDFGFTFANLFDTMQAARVLGRKNVGLGSLLEDYFGVRVNKAYQRANWAVRPLPREQLDYARMDTHYLPALRDMLRKELEEKDHLTEALELFEAITALSPSVQIFDPDGYWHINAARDLSRRQMAILRELYLLRDQLAFQRDVPPFKIATDEALATLARSGAQTIAEITALPGCSGLGRYGSEFVAAVKRGWAAPLPSRPSEPRIDDATLARYNRLRDWRKARAAERGVESDVIISKEALWAMAVHVPQTMTDLESVTGLGPWRRERYGEALLRLLAEDA